jgi:predicted nucleic acid-binding protein
MSEAALVDTNVLIRFLTGDPPGLAERARELFSQAATGELELQLPVIVIAETIFTLESLYKIEKRDICEKLGVLLRGRGISVLEAEPVLDALRRYRSLRVSFVDAYLAALASHRKQPVCSFDRDFAKFEDVNWRH